MATWGDMGEDRVLEDSFNVIVSVQEVQHLVWPAPVAGASKPQGKASLPNPRVEVIVPGSSQVTQTQSSTASCSYNKTFNFQNVVPEDPSLSQIEIRVNHVKVYFWQELIGMCNVTFDSVYQRKDHCIIRTWMPLTTPERPTEPRGYIRVSIWVLRPNDHMKAEAEVASSVTPAPDGISFEFEKYYVNLNVHIGQDIMHPESMGQPPQAGDGDGVKLPDCSVRAIFSGTKLQTGTASNSYTPVWNQSLKLPARVPCIEDKIRLELVNDALDPPEVLGFQNLSFSQLLKGDMRPTWINFYRQNRMKRRANAFSLFGGDGDIGSSGGGIEYLGRVLISVDVKKAKTRCYNDQVPR